MDKGQGSLLEASPSTGHQSIEWLAIFTLIHGNIIAKQHATFQQKEIRISIFNNKNCELYSQESHSLPVWIENL